MLQELETKLSRNLSTTQIILPQQHFYSAIASLWSGDNLLHSNIPNQIHDKFHGPTLRTYITERASWDDETFDKVDWEALQIYYQKQSHRQRTHLCKYIHQWQNVGKQKARIDQHTEEQACPFNCGGIEEPSHYWYCKAEAMRKVISMKLTEFGQFLHDIETEKHVLWVITTCLEFHLAGDDDSEFVNPSTKRDQAGNENLLSKTLTDQREIGWDHFLRGRLSLGWRALQDKHFKTTGTYGHMTGIIWASQVIGEIFKISLELWKLRNEVLHGFDYKDSQDKLRKKLVSKITRAYENHYREVTPDFQHLFKETCEKTLTASNRTLYYWNLSFEIAHYAWDTQRNTEIGEESHDTRSGIRVTGRRRPPD